MKIKLESTATITRLDGVECRVWEGTTESGVPIVAFIPRIACKRDADNSELERELFEKSEPRCAADAWPLRMVL
jgi:hypothetical protein